jgi:TrmH family RNA methyltransferase
LRRRAQREASGLFLVEGIRAAFEAAEQGAELEELYFAPELLRSAIALDLVDRLRERGVVVLEVTADVFGSLSAREGPQGIAGVVRQRWSRLEDARTVEGLGWVALDGIQDPGNLGTILRTCDAVGAAGAILLGETADPYDPSAVRASTGAVFGRRLIRASLEDLLVWARASRVRVVGTSDRAAISFRAPVYNSPLVLLMGSERKGLDESTRGHCDAVVSIPMLGSCDSLNLAVATGVILYEALNQRMNARGNAQAGAQRT